MPFVRSTLEVAVAEEIGIPVGAGGPAGDQGRSHVLVDESTLKRGLTVLMSVAWSRRMRCSTPQRTKFVLQWGILLLLKTALLG